MKLMWTIAFSCLSLVMLSPIWAEDRPIAISDKGIGPITATTPFDAKEVARLLPQFTVKESDFWLEGEGMTIPLIEVWSGEKKMFEIAPGEQNQGIHGITVFDATVVNSLGPVIGDRFSKIYGNAMPSNCNPIDRPKGGMYCPAPGSKSILYTFTGQSDVPLTKLPPLSVLKNYSLKEIYWYVY